MAKSKLEGPDSLENQAPKVVGDLIFLLNELGDRIEPRNKKTIMDLVTKADQEILNGKGITPETQQKIDSFYQEYKDLKQN